MNTPTPRILLFVLAWAAFGLSSCILAFNVAWLPGDVDSAERLRGAWTVTTYGDGDGDKIPTDPWILEKSEVTHPSGKRVPGLLMTLKDPEKRSAELELVFFKLGATLFCESRVLKSGAAEVASEHLISLGTVTKVIEKKGQLDFHPLDRDFIKAHGKELKIRDIDGKMVIRATTQKWRAFLTQNAKAAFDKRPIIALERKVAPTSGKKSK
jgi:hypothetical protein